MFVAKISQVGEVNEPEGHRWVGRASLKNNQVKIDLCAVVAAVGYGRVDSGKLELTIAKKEHKSTHKGCIHLKSRKRMRARLQSAHPTTTLLIVCCKKKQYYERE